MSNLIKYGSDGKTLVEKFVDNGDDTATHYVYENGEVVSQEVVEWQSDDGYNHQTVAIPKAAIEQLANDMNDPSINSIAEIKSAITNFVDRIQ